MIKIKFKTDDLIRKLSNTVRYSNGFLSGIEKGKVVFLKNLGEGTIVALNQYIDAMARSDREALHHVYEWYQEGSPAARLFDFSYSASKGGLSLNGTFRQSNSASRDASKPFYDKARIMELGIPVSITPSGGGALRFNVGGEEVFTKNSVRVNNPGGDEVQGSFQRVFDNFMKNYFKQSFLKASGLYDYLKNPNVYKKNFAQGVKNGESIGVKTGYNWITNATVGVKNG
jgi:hypothetical protein